MRYRNRNRNRSPASRLAGLIFLVFLFLAFFTGGTGGGFFLPLLFVGLAFATLIGSLATFNPRGVYGGIQGFVWMLGIALCFAVGSFWPWILIPIILSGFLGILLRPIMALLLGIGIFGAANMMNQQQPMYQQPYQPYQPPIPPYQPPAQQGPYQAYDQGYQSVPEPSPETYREGGQQYPYPQSYEQPQAQYPQELPPQQQ